MRMAGLGWVRRFGLDKSRAGVGRVENRAKSANGRGADMRIRTGEAFAQFPEEGQGMFGVPRDSFAGGVMMVEREREGMKSDSGEESGCPRGLTRCRTFEPSMQSLYTNESA